jgi:hypothetical protein
LRTTEKAIAVNARTKKQVSTNELRKNCHSIRNLSDSYCLTR